MNRNVKIASWTAAVLAAVLVLLLILIATFNWNRARPWLSERVSQALGRAVAINGDLTVNWHRNHADGWLRALVPWPQFTARDVSIGNPAWAKEAQFAHLDALRFDLSPLPLLGHRISLSSVQLVQPTVHLQRDEDGRATWTFTPEHADKPSAWTLQVGSIGLDRGQITLADALTESQLDIAVTPLQQAIPYDQIVAQQSDEARDQAQKTAGPAASSGSRVPWSKSPSSRRSCGPESMSAWSPMATHTKGSSSPHAKTPYGRCCNGNGDPLGTSTQL